METIDKTIAIISAPHEYTERYFQTHVKFTQDQSSPHLSPHSHTKTQKFLPDTTKIDEATKAANTKHGITGANNDGNTIQFNILQIASLRHVKMEQCCANIICLD